MKLNLNLPYPFSDVVAVGIELRSDRKRLREEYTAAKRHELFDKIERNDPNSPEARRAQAELSHFLTSLQINSAERGARQLAFATAAIAAATLGLIGATLVLALIHH